MTVTSTPRLGLTRWTDTDGADPFRREQLDGDHQRLDAKVVGFLVGTTAARPAATSALAHFVYLDPNAPSVHYCTGSSWLQLELSSAAVARLNAHLNDAADAHDASAISFAPTGAVAAATVQAAIAELDAEKETPAGAQGKADAAVENHRVDTTDVHGIADTAALETTAGAQAKVDAHVNDADDAHDASAVSYDGTASGLAATDAQAAVDEVVDDLGTHADLTGDNGHIIQQPNIAQLAMVVSDPPTQAEVQSIADKVDELVAAVQAAGVTAV